MSLFPPNPLDHSAWKMMHDSWLGASVLDPDGHQIGNASARKTVGPFPVGNWQPVDGHKHALVGEVDRYNFYNPWGSGDEADFNIYITPSPVFADVLDTVVRRMSPNEKEELHKRTRGNGYCLEAEVTPDESYYNNIWFPTNSKKCPLVGKQIAVYGPWVRDWSHGGRPEIHPAEAIWWRAGDFDGKPQLTRWNFIFLQDDSNRFDRPDNYDAPVARPWSAFPRRAHVTVALQAFRGQTTEYHLNLNHQRRVKAFRDQDASASSSLQDGTRLNVIKGGEAVSKVRTKLGRLFNDPHDNNRLGCFLEFDVEFGTGDRGNEGLLDMGIQQQP